VRGELDDAFLCRLCLAGTGRTESFLAFRCGDICFAVVVEVAPPIQLPVVIVLLISYPVLMSKHGCGVYVGSMPSDCHVLSSISGVGVLIASAV
jgi:hypothetical protein